MKKCHTQPSLHSDVNIWTVRDNPWRIKRPLTWGHFSCIKSIKSSFMSPWRTISSAPVTELPQANFCPKVLLHTFKSRSETRTRMWTKYLNKIIYYKWVNMSLTLNFSSKENVWRRAQFVLSTKESKTRYNSNSAVYFFNVMLMHLCPFFLNIQVSSSLSNTKKCLNTVGRVLTYGYSRRSE